MPAQKSAALDKRRYTITFARAVDGRWVEAAEVHELPSSTIAMKCRECGALMPSDSKPAMLRAAAHDCDSKDAPPPALRIRMREMADAADRVQQARSVAASQGSPREGRV